MTSNHPPSASSQPKYDSDSIDWKLELQWDVGGLVLCISEILLGAFDGALEGEDGFGACALDGGWGH